MRERKKRTTPPTHNFCVTGGKHMPLWGTLSMTLFLFTLPFHFTITTTSTGFSGFFCRATPSKSSDRYRLVPRKVLQRKGGARSNHRAYCTGGESSPQIIEQEERGGERDSEEGGEGWQRRHSSNTPSTCFSPGPLSPSSVAISLLSDSFVFFLFLSNMRNLSSPEEVLLEHRQWVRSSPLCFEKVEEQAFRHRMSLAHCWRDRLLPPSPPPQRRCSLRSP